jgi:hypothetical protein
LDTFPLDKTYHGCPVKKLLLTQKQFLSAFVSAKAEKPYGAACLVRTTPVLQPSVSAEFLFRCFVAGRRFRAIASGQ